jgi:hypothetical protein
LLSLAAGQAFAQTPPAEQPATPATPATPTTPAPVPPASTEPAPAPAPLPVAQPLAAEPAPLQFRIGSAYITPIGFMDFTGVFRTKDVGSGIGTGFAGIPYNYAYGNKLSETRLSMQNSRVGFRVDAPVEGAHVIGYMEADFLGNNAGNVAVSTNSNTLRSRLYWVDVRKGALELLAGQSWSLITPGRSGISPLPSDVFFTQDIDVNYQPGLVWARNPELRLTYHPSKTFAMAIALDNPEQYIGGTNGSTAITLPAGFLSTLAGTQLDNGTTTLGVPNLVPDVIVKVAADPSSQVHVELGGIERQFKVWDPNPTVDTTFSATGLGGFFNFGLEPVRGLRLLSNNFYGSGAGRYIYGQAPDLIVNVDGSITPVTTWSTVDGFELALGRTSLYGYYSYLKVDQTESDSTAGVACTSAATCVGYGYPGASSGQNKWIQEGTLGFIETFWKNPKVGALSLMGQYSYLARAPWSLPVNGSADAHTSMVFLNLRYSLPGESPKM